MAFDAEEDDTVEESMVLLVLAPILSGEIIRCCFASLSEVVSKRSVRQNCYHEMSGDDNDDCDKRMLIDNDM